MPVPSTCIPLKSSSRPSLEVSATWHLRCSITKATVSPWTSGQSGTHARVNLLMNVLTTITPYSASIITYVLLCGYSPFRSDDMKELMRQTTEAKINFHDRYWNNVSDEGARLCTLNLDSLTLTQQHKTAKGFIRALLNPDPTKRLTASEALSHPWLTSKAEPEQQQPDLSGLRENFDPRARWRNAIGAARAISRLGLVQRSRSKLMSSEEEDEDDDDDGEGANTTHLSPKVNPRALRVSASSSSSSLAISPTALEPPPKVVDAPEPTPHLKVEKEVEVERRIPGSFNYEAADENVSASASASTSPIDVVGVLSGIWRRFHIRA